MEHTAIHGGVDLDMNSTKDYYDDFGNTSWNPRIPNMNNEDFYPKIKSNFSTTDFESLGWGDVGLVSLFCSIIAGTVAGNTLVIAAVITTRRLRTVTNCFVMSLAVADWLVGVFVMPPKVALYLVHNEWKLGGFFCELWIALDILLCTASILSLCAISIDRYLAITRPLAYSRRRRSKRLALSMISCVWVAAAIITSPPIFGWYEENRNVENKCEYNENTGYVVYSALGSFFLPLLVMLYVYARIACVIARRQNSIQRLANSSEKKSHCCGGNDFEAEEPLHHRNANVQESLEPGDREAQAEPGGSKYGSSPDDKTRQMSAKRAGGVAGDVACKATGGFWSKLPFRSCTSGDEDSHSGNGTKRSSSGGQKSGASDSDTNSGSGIAISLPDPATLSGSVECAIASTCLSDVNNDNTISRSGCSSPRINKNQQPFHQPSKSQPPSRLRTGSRLAQHSVATTSPQRNIHRVHQTTSSATRLFPDNELVPLEESTLSKSAPRVWTVEETSSNALVGSSRNKSQSSNGRATSFKLERNGRTTRFGISVGGGAGRNCTTLAVPMSNSPAGNPASIMSSPNVTSPTGEASGSQNTSTRTTTSNRIYHPQPSNHYHNHQQHHSSNLNSIHRGRSMKLTLNLHGNDHNQNGSTMARDFSSGRVASFKRETKTAQTLAAVVGGFIICWLPFFVAYVIGPFIPSEIIPTALMDALIWLGWSNSTINPFIYAFYSQDFRSAFWRLTVRKCSVLFLPRNTGRRSPRRFDDHNNTHSRVST